MDCIYMTGSMLAGLPWHALISLDNMLLEMVSESTIAGTRVNLI